MADSGGVIRIPLEIAEKVLERARNIRGKEAKIFAYYKSAEFKVRTCRALTSPMGHWQCLTRSGAVARTDHDAECAGGGNDGKDSRARCRV